MAMRGMFKDVDKNMGCFTFIFLFFLIVLTPVLFFDEAGIDDNIKGKWVFISAFVLLGIASGEFKKFLNLFK